MILVILVVLVILYLIFTELERNGGYSGGSLTLRDPDGSIFKSLKDKKKTVEIRKNSDFVNNDIKGDSVVFETDDESMTVKIKEIKKYADLDSALKEIDIKDVYPSMSEHDGMALLKKYNSEESVEYWRNENGHGIVAIFLDGSSGPSHSKKETKKETKKHDEKHDKKETKKDDKKDTKKHDKKETKKHDKKETKKDDKKETKK